VLGAAATKGDLDVAAQVAENGTRYNLLGDHSAKLRDEAREKFSQTGDLKAARELVRLEGADQRSDELRAAYLRDPSSLSQKELAEFTAYLQVYAYERLKAVGPEKAQASFDQSARRRSGVRLRYPYAGSKEQNCSGPMRSAVSWGCWGRFGRMRGASTSGLTWTLNMRCALAKSYGDGQPWRSGHLFPGWINWQCDSGGSSYQRRSASYAGGQTGLRRG
jgi:hypothetical protein